eukprot:XP_024465887.1 uncharacterized protein LOC18102381 [Populus trichocarpa]
MAENSSNGASSMASASARSDDPAWAHGQVVVGAKNSSICVHCSKRINGGGITRLKYHLAGIKGQVEACKKVPPDVKWQIKQLIKDLTMEKEKRKRLRTDIGNSQSLSNDEVEEGGSANPTLSDIGSKANKRLTMQDTSANRKKMTSFVPRTTPSSHLALKVQWLLKRRNIMQGRWVVNRRNVPIVNFLAYSLRGTIFLKSVDTLGLRKDKETLLEMFDEVVKEVGQENIVQFVSDNEAAFKAARKALQQRYDTFFWSLCAAHCIDLMLENISDPRYFSMIDETIKKARNITKFIYNHAWVLALMRKDFTNGNDLCRPGITRFATHFLSIQCLLKFKKELRQMFTCMKWVESSHGKSKVGKEITAIILHDKDFWPRCEHIVKVSEPLVRVLRLADSEEKPSMGYLYEAMDKAKEAIKTRLKNRVSQYGPYIRVIDARWDKQLHSPLHAAGCFLNPGIYFRPSFSKQKEVTRGLLSTITRLVPDCDTQDVISGQLEEYKKATGDFGMLLAIRQREKLNPVAWWEQFGNDTHELQKFAIRILSHCYSATGNLSKTRDVLDPISLDNIDLLNEWICKEPSLLNGDDISWETIEAPLSTLTLEDEKTCFDEENELGGNDQLLECLVDDFPYIPPQDQDPYFYVNDGDDV